MIHGHCAARRFQRRHGPLPLAGAVRSDPTVQVEYAIHLPRRVKGRHRGAGHQPVEDAIARSSPKMAEAIVISCGTVYKRGWVNSPNVLFRKRPAANELQQRIVDSRLSFPPTNRNSAVNGPTGGAVAARPHARCATALHTLQRRMHRHPGRIECACETPIACRLKAVLQTRLPARRLVGAHSWRHRLAQKPHSMPRYFRPTKPIAYVLISFWRHIEIF